MTGVVPQVMNIKKSRQDVGAFFYDIKKFILKYFGSVNYFV